MEKDSVQLVVDGARASLTVCRPESLNALNQDVLTGILLALDKLSRDPAIRVLTITGAGEKAFVAGADIATMSQLGPRPIADYIELGQRVMRALESASFPIIAAVNGFALGGGLELALACDLIAVSDSAKLGQPEVNLGIIPGFGGTQRLVHRCGVGTARRLCFTGDMIDAAEAHRLGVADYIFPQSEFREAIAKLEEKICAKAPLAVQGAKRVIRAAVEQPLLSGLRREVEEFLELFGSLDREEGMSAFMQKRAALFSGK